MAQVLSKSNESARALDVPSTVPAGHQTVAANYVGYSVEFAFMADYAGNDSYPNEFSIRLVENLYNITGEYPMFRAGGSSQNRVTYNASQEVGVINTFDSPTDQQPSAVSIGPAWVQSFQQLPEGTKYIYGTSFYDQDDPLCGGCDGLNETVTEAKLVYDGIGEALYGYEIGNEVDGWPGGSRRPINWTINVYVAQWAQYAEAVLEAIGIDEPLLQGCAFEAPRHLGYNETPFWNVENAVAFGMNKTLAVTVADHDYMGAACDTTSYPTIEGNLLNHTHVTSILYYHDYLGNATAGSGIPYVLGETNSISCQGQPGISDVFAAALWSVDYVMYLASLKVERVYFHSGTSFFYSAWQPIEWNGTAAHVNPLYYGNLFTSTVLAGGNKQVAVLANETSFTAYAVYDANSTALQSVVIANLDIFNSTMPAEDRSYITVQLPTEFEGGAVRRLTNPGVDTAENITFAGQWIGDDGSVLGSEVVEPLENSTVSVGAGEAVLVSV
ncbi:family 79 glycoside hydrolase [Cryphonectria parasitica EP155]|uniref:Family 79 glycoside hydrolase n=1 Tax=Cryphonectria parasitica (strain ATCC 38755 / EP155) TaxID=660469 RepID=A0A9P4XVM7_CRYP1|nr:family 79 glycoside hydrolase [Cryphonectria parasitica EP155]KAF3762129.1 family 79 glycoside hydrolase [Cryphonectria parasitica EP155]